MSADVIRPNFRKPALDRAGEVPVAELAGPKTRCQREFAVKREVRRAEMAETKATRAGQAARLSQTMPGLTRA